MLFLFFILFAIQSFSFRISPKSNCFGRVSNLYSQNPFADDNFSNGIPNNNANKYREDALLIIKRISLLGLSIPLVSNADYLASSPQDIIYRKPLVNVQSDDFWYPPYMIGKWNTTMKFAGATFTNDIPIDKLAKDNSLPGFTKYSVIFAPDIGVDIQDLILRYAQVDSHPREDHSFNIRNLVQSFIPTAVVDSAPYAYQKAPDWFHSPANYWSFKYHDEKGNGEVDLLTLKRNLSVYAGVVESLEFFRQTHRRSLKSNPLKISTTVSDYAINWRLSVPESLKDEFVTVQDLSKTNILVGQLNILAYFQPSSEFYFKVPAQPAGVYTYNVTLNRINNVADDTKQTEYPFVWRDDGPVELEKYFGY
eukprot:gene6582-9048_t